MIQKSDIKIPGNSQNWNEHWDKETQLNWFGRRLHNAEYKTIKKVVKKIDLPLNSKIIDIGCGSGRTLIDWRRLGFINSIGIDQSDRSINTCHEAGLLLNRDVFLMDGTETTFQNNEFDLVFSMGLLEHFKDFTPFINEMTRISKKYILIMQPNHFSIYRKIIDKISGVPVDEYTHYKTQDYITSFERYNAKFLCLWNINLNEQFALLFKKEE